MVQIRPFSAIRYNTQQSRDLSSRVAPPYDVLNAEHRHALLAGDPCNIVAIDLPHMPPSSLGPPEAYARSAAILQQWLQQKVLIQDDRPAIYYYRQCFELAGTKHTRSAFFCRVRLEPLGAGAIMPHEQTFSGPKEDRLALTKATRCNLSQVFGLYPDPDNRVIATLEPQDSPADGYARLNDVLGEMWIVREPSRINQMVQLMAEKKIYIADGHHRYGTSLDYRRFLQESGQALDEEHPANYISMALVSTADPGLMILPTHRLMRDLPADYLDTLRTATVGQFEWIATGLSAAQVEVFDAIIAEKHPQAIGLYDRKQDQLRVLVPRSRDLLKDYEPHRSAAWRNLSVAILHRYLFQEKLFAPLAPHAKPRIDYIKGAVEAIHSCRWGEHQAAFLLQPATMAQMLAVIEAGELMPHKSTFFYPKAATGLVINPLY